MALLDEYIEKNKAKSPAETAVQTTAPVASASPVPTGVQGYLRSTLEGKNPIVQNAQAQQNTSSSVQKYLAGKTARDTSAQAGFNPGTLQYQRTQDRTQAAADQNILQGQNQVNDLTRTVSQQALSDKSALDSSALSSVTDPKAKAYLQTVLASGGDVQEALAGMYDNGVLKEEYRSPSAGAQLRLDAEDIVKNTYPDLAPGSPEFEAAVNQRLQTADKATTAPVQTAATEAEVNAVRQKARAGQALTDAEKEILAGATDLLAASALPSSKEAVEAAINSGNPFIKLDDGNVYQIQDYYQQKRWDRGGGKERNRDWTVVKDLSTGETAYISSSGERVNYKPPEAPSGKKITFKNGRFEQTDGNGYYDPAQQKWVTNFKGVTRRPPSVVF